MSSPILANSLVLLPTHSMIIISKAGIFKAEVYYDATLINDHFLPFSVQEALSNVEWKKAMEYEYQALSQNQTSCLVLYEDGMNIVSNKWVYRVKFKAYRGLAKYKARLVAKGFQQTTRIDFFETFSRVIKSSTIHVVLILAVSYGWDIQ